MEHGLLRLALSFVIPLPYKLIRILSLYKGVVGSLYGLLLGFATRFCGLGFSASVLSLVLAGCRRAFNWFRVQG